MACARSLVVLLAFALAGCGGGPSGGSTRKPVQEPLVGGPFPALLVAQAQFVETTRADGKTEPVPGFARLAIVRRTPQGWKTAVLEDPESNVFHKALPWADGFLTIGGTEARLKTWRFTDGRWEETTRWNPHFGGKFDRLRDVAAGDVDGDGTMDLVIATHDQGVIAVVHPSEGWRVEEIDRQPDTFVHDVRIGDVDGDGIAEVFATPSQPNKLDAQQAGEVRMYKHAADGWHRALVERSPDTHAKEILTADVDGTGVSLFAVWEGAIGAGGALLRPVTVKQYRWRDGGFESRVIATVPDRMMRHLAAGDVDGDGKVDLVGGSLASGLWLFEQDGRGGWTARLIDRDSSGFEHPVCLADLDGDGHPSIYVGSEDQQELREYRWDGTRFVKTVLAPLRKGDITFNITAARL